MKILIFTQKVDKNDSVLGFFHNWLVEIAKKAESVEVICLEKGIYSLPKNVTVYSLGKEKGVSKIGQLKNLYHYVLLIRGSYNKVFVHMNQEYVLLLGIYWKLKGIPVYLWRNHPRGDFLTRIAILLSTKVFCTSKESFTARFKKTVIMPVGNDQNIFKPVSGIVRKKYSVCMVGRISPIKHIELALQAVNILVLSGTQISFDIVGSPTEKDLAYYDSLKKYIVGNNLSSSVNLLQDVPFLKHPEIYSSYEICLNLTESGSFDKSIVGATSCGAIPLVSNTSLSGLLPKVCITEPKPQSIANSLKTLMEAHTQVEIKTDLESFAKSQDLNRLIEKLFLEMK